MLIKMILFVFILILIKMNINYPTFNECLTKYGSMNLSDFVRNILNENYQIDLDINYFNVATDEKISIKNNKPIRYYLFNREPRCLVLNIIPNIETLIKINGKFDVNNGLLFSKSLDKLRECDINIDQLLPFVKYSIDFNVFDTISSAIKQYISSIKVNITLKSNKENILVLCANTETIESNKYKNLIKDTLGEISYENVDTYFVGEDIGKENRPNILRVLFQNFNINNESSKFDIIIFEYCPCYECYNNIEKLNYLLSDNGIIMMPNYNLEKSTFLNYFEIINNPSGKLNIYKKITI